MTSGVNLYGEVAQPGATSKIEKNKQTADGPVKSDTLAKYWREVERYKAAMSAWTEEGENIESLYLSEAETRATARKFALLWANVEVMKPALYSKLPAVVCGRRYKDRKPVVRIAAELIERATNTSFDLYGAHSTFKMVRDDRLVPGRGQGWVRYHATIERTENKVKSIDNETGEETEQVESHERVTSEKVCADYVHWTCFGHNVGRVWKDDVWLVWRIVFMQHDQAVERFGSKKAAGLSYDVVDPSASAGSAATSTEAQDNCAAIYEFWDRKRNLTSWAALGTHDFLESGEPPINFRDFFPCPEPCYATRGTKKLVPVPDYRYYRDQAREINDLTDKIHHLMEHLKVKAFVPGGPSTVADAIEEAVRDKSNTDLFVQVESLKDWTDRGGAARLIDWMPIDMIVKALDAAIKARTVLIQDVYQLMGISDILRGATDPKETLGAQELKAQTGSRRLKESRDEHARWCRDMAQLCAEVIAELFSPQTIADITGYRYVPQRQPMLAQPQRLALPAPSGMGAPGMPQQGMPVPGAPTPGVLQLQPGQDSDEEDQELVFDDEVMALLRNDKLRSFTIDVETDQTGQGDENAEKERRVELMQGASAFMKEFVQLGMTSPAMATVAKELFMFTVRSFRAGRSMEEALERAFDTAIKEARQAQQARAQQPDPEMEKAKGELMLAREVAKGELSLEAEKAKAETQLATQKQQTDASLALRKLNIDAALKSRQNEMTATAQARRAEQSGSPKSKSTLQ